MNNDTVIVAPRPWPTRVALEAAAPAATGTGRTENAADLTLMLMLMIARRITSAGPAALPGKTLGLIGLGQVGREVARRAHHGFGMRVLAYDPAAVDADEARTLGVEVRTTMEEVLAEADFVSLHCPSEPANVHLIDARRLGQMKPDAFLISTARGPLIDQQALVHALWFETIAGVALDVDPSEGQVARELLACPNAILLPREGLATCEAAALAGYLV
jgi:glyoxylate reductase